jgi:hypothetical protein
MLRASDLPAGGALVPRLRPRAGGHLRSANPRCGGVDTAAARAAVDTVDCADMRTMTFDDDCSLA